MRSLWEAASQVADAAQAGYERAFCEETQVFQVRPNLFVMDFPSENKIDRLGERLRTEFQIAEGGPLILNMSERRYSAARLFPSADVVDVGFRGLPSPPLQLLAELCLLAQSWLEGDAKHVLIVHCFAGFSRSVVFLACFLAFHGLHAHPVDGLHEVCGCLGLSDAKAVQPSQRRYLTYFAQCLAGLSPEGVSVRRRLLRVTLNNPPQFEMEGPTALRPVLEIWGSGNLLYSSHAEPSSASKVMLDLPEGIAQEDPCRVFVLPELPELALRGDVLMRVRHVYSGGSRETCLRAAFHVGLAPPVMQLAKHELDGACHDGRFSCDFSLDLIFGDPELDQAQDRLTTIFGKAQEASQRMQAKEAERQQNERAQAIINAQEVEVLEKRRAEEEALEASIQRWAHGGSGSAISSAATVSVSPAAPARVAEADVDAELKQALAAAAAEPSSAPGDSKALRTAKATTPSASKPVPPPQPSHWAVQDASKNASDELDDLFGEFSSLDPPPSTGAIAPKEKALAQVDSAGTSDELFGDVDAFMKELDDAASRHKG